MAKDAIVSDELAQKFATEKDTPYLRFVRGEGLDIISAHYVPSLRTVELKPWARRGANASRPARLPRPPAWAADECGLWLGAGDREPGQHHWERH